MALLPDLPWDPGQGSTNDENACPTPVNPTFYTQIANVTEGGDMSMPVADEVSRTELDSHANMPVVGRHAYVVANNKYIHVLLRH